MRLSLRMQQAVESFSDSIGAPAKAAPDGSYSFLFSRSGLLTFSCSEDGERLFVCLSQKPSTPDSRTEFDLLALAGFEPDSNTFLHSGLASDGSLVLAVELSDDQASLPSLDAALQRLMEARESLN